MNIMHRADIDRRCSKALFTPQHNQADIMDIHPYSMSVYKLQRLPENQGNPGNFKKAKKRILFLENFSKDERVAFSCYKHTMNSIQLEQSFQRHVQRKLSWVFYINIELDHQSGWITTYEYLQGTLSSKD